jgi:phage terminase large subunit
MAKIRLPNGWRPREYQLPAWEYLENGGKHAELIWHRRSGKDEIALHRTACAAFERQATYWHMLPEAAQARKAIWEAINPHSGKRRIDEAFPHEIRATTKDHEMMIRFVNGSTWQVLGSDNYNSLVGSPPAGVVFSEWALANPAARAYLRPIFAENNGWQMYITTPRGKNHAHKTFEAAKKTPGAFAQKLTAYDTGSITPERLAAERQAYIEDYGYDQGVALFEQEYMCSFDAALLGAYYGGEMRQAETQGRVCKVPHDPAVPVYTAWDLGYSDDTGIWWYQVVRGEIHVLEYYGASGADMKHYAEQVLGREVLNDEWLTQPDAPIKLWAVKEGLERRTQYRYAMHNLPHDARAKTLASGGRSIQEMAWKAFGADKVRIVPNVGLQSGIQAVRAILPRCYFDEEGCGGDPEAGGISGIEAMKQYRREWDDDRKVFRDTPLHDWTSHPADGFRMLAVAWQEEFEPKKQGDPRYPTDRTIDELIAAQRRKRQE